MIKLGIVMDPIASINIKKDTSFSMLLEAQRRGYKIYYMEINSLYLYKNEARASTRLLFVEKNDQKWFDFTSDKQNIQLKELDVILMRKDPPFTTELLYATYILEIAQKQGVLVINNPKSIRDYNEKLFPSKFIQHTTDSLVSCCEDHIREFWQKHDDIIIKPINKMGGDSIFRIKKNDPNFTVIIENMTGYGQYFCMAQKYLPSIKDGDKRVLVVNGQPIPYCLARIPKIGETRGNLASGGHGEVRPLSDNDWKIALDISPILQQQGLIFVGLDIIGNYLTEINITSPTCVQEIESVIPISITGMLMDAIEDNLNIARTRN